MNEILNTGGNEKDWHILTVDEIFHSTGSNMNGLTEEEAGKRLKEYGPNELEEGKRVSPFILLFNQFKDFLIIVLAIAAIVSGIKGDWVEAITIIVIVILAGVLGFIQEYQAGKAIDALKKMTAPHATVLRAGEKKNIPAGEIVTGDIVLIKTGDLIPADGRLIEVNNLQVNESSLTGESMSVEKSIESPDIKDTTIGDRKNMIYTGTSVSYGRGKALITATGMKTEFGKIALMLQTAEKRKTPLQNNLDQLGKWLGIFALVLSGIIALFGVLSGQDMGKMFVWGVALAVAVIPEALPAVVTISLALGVRRLVKKKALIRTLPSVETLGATTVICSDKTGTLTQDQMTIRKIYTDRKMIDVTGSGYSPEGEFLFEGKTFDTSINENLQKLFKAGILCNDTILKKEDGKWVIIGDPTEGSLVVIAEKAGIRQDEIREKFPRIKEIPFTSESKRMTTIHKEHDGEYAYSKGAPEIILEACSFIDNTGNIVSMTEGHKKQILDKAQEMGEKALRVIALAFKKLSKEDSLETSEKEMVFSGLTGMIDPPRPEVKEAILVCEKAGIKPVMITGDHKVTAIAVAKELGLMKNDRALTGQEIDKMSDTELNDIVEGAQVYARISPAHKLRIVDAFMKKGHVVAMTGDGVNDAPALKKADIGVAMGITGTDVSKEASDMILTDDNFASIVSAVEEGRSIFENIRKYLVFLLSGNMGTVFAMIISLAIYNDFPLVAVQILFINLIMDGFVAIALGVEPPEPSLMEKPPRNLKEGILNTSSLLYIFGIGLWIAMATMGVYIWARLSPLVDDGQAMSMFFTALIIARLFNGLNCRSPKESIFRTGLAGNKWLMGSFLLSTVLTVMILYLPVFHIPFGTKPLTLFQWIVISGSASTVLIVIEIKKLIKHFLR